MGKIFQQLKKAMTRFLSLALLTAGLSFGASVPAYALSAGTYTVTVKPYYRDPVTGVIEDPGNNEAVGQGMCERMCGSTGLLEVESDGSMYLTVRYYLSSFVHDPSFEERTSGGSSFGSAISYQIMQTKDPVEGAANIEDKYGYTDFRLPVSSIDSTFRGKAYINPPGKHVVYYFQASNPVAGSGDFITSGTAQEANVSASAESASQSYSDAQSVMGDILDSSDAEEEDSSVRAAGSKSSSKKSSGASSDSSIGDTDNNGSGSADDEVTGIPLRPKDLVSLTTGETTAVQDTSSKASTGAADEDLSLQTKYDLDSVDLTKARKLTDPILEAATGIAGTTDGVVLDLSSTSSTKSAKDSRVSTNKLVMLLLLLVSAGLLGWFGFVQIRQKQQRQQEQLPKESDVPETSDAADMQDAPQAENNLTTAAESPLEIEALTEPAVQNESAGEGGQHEENE